MLRLMLIAIVFVTTLLASNDALARRYSRSYTKNVINKTAYIIEQAYDIAYTYDYWTEHYLSKAVYYNDYAYDLYRRDCRSAAVHYSLKSRQYALMVIDNCDDYWEYFYFNYFGWSFSFGYNSNFAYANGYANGYYDGYFAAYCNRHGHNPHHHNHGHQPPHHNGHNNHNQGHNPSHGTMKPTNGHVIGRGETGATNPNVTTGSGTITRGSFKNINYDEYFSAEELKDIKDLPNETALENNFKKERPNVSFDSKELSKPNNEMIRRTKEISQEYTKENNSKGQTTLTRQIIPTATLTREVQSSFSKETNTPNKEIKPSNKETKPTTNATKPINKEVKPINKEEQTPNKEIKPTNKEIKPANKEVKPANKEVGTINKDTKPANKEVKPQTKETKPTNKEIKPTTSKETKPANKEMKSSNTTKPKTTASKSTKNTKTNNKATKTYKSTKRLSPILFNKVQKL